MRPRTAGHLEALSLEIERKLHKALNSNSQRLKLLQQLFADIALKVDDRARDKILSTNDEGIAPVDEREDGHLCFYEILANHYVKVPQSGRRILELIVQLWSQSFAANIFALLFHRWLFEVPLEGKEVSLRYSSALVQGATNVFWIDIQTNTRHFLPLYHVSICSNARILQPTSESVSDTVSDTDTPPIRPRYVSLEYPRINDLKRLRYSKDTLPVRFGYFSSPGKSPLSPVKRQPATLVPRCAPSFRSQRLSSLPCPHEEAAVSQGQRRQRRAGDELLLLLTNVPSHAAAKDYLLEEVALVPDQLIKISPQAARNLFCLLSRFMLFYDQDHLLTSFLEHFPAFPNSFLVGGAADYFVIELTDQLQKLKVEPVLLHYLSRMTILQGWELRMSTSTRLKSCLYSFTSPGGPAYPTRAVRHAAWNTLDLLFPVGRYPRHVISLFFRLLYPWYWPSSCWNFVMTCVSTIYYYIMNLLVSIWENMRRRNHQRMHRE